LDDDFKPEDIQFAVEWTLKNAKEELYDFSIIKHTIGQAIVAKKKAEEGEVPEGSGVILSTGYGKNWEREDYLKKCPFLNKAAMDYLIDRKPFIVVFDTPAAENDVHPENAFDRYFEENILTVTAVVNLEKITQWRVKLVVMPMKLLKVKMGSPARAIVIEQ